MNNFIYFPSQSVVFEGSYWIPFICILCPFYVHSKKKYLKSLGICQKDMKTNWKMVYCPYLNNLNNKIMDIIIDYNSNIN
jgi:hypothetical protein